MHRLVGEDDHGFDAPGVPPAPGCQITQRTAERRIEVRQPRAREGDPERVAAGAGERVALVAPDANGAARDPPGLRAEPLLCPRALVGGERPPRLRPVGACGEPDDHHRCQRSGEPRGRAAPPGRPYRRRQVPDSVLVLDDLAEPEIRVLGAGAEAAASTSRARSRRPRRTNSISAASSTTSGSQNGIHARRSSRKSQATTKTRAAARSAAWTEARFHMSARVERGGARLDCWLWLKARAPESGSGFSPSQQFPGLGLSPSQRFQPSSRRLPGD